MITKEAVTVSMSLNEALDIVKEHCVKTALPDNGPYKFKAWNNDIPADLLHEKEMIKITFEKA